ncbi:MAG TPA: M14 metallopeptidase family protein, partial [Candidatus Polarisedimenticolia bacterium]|nr:M14 metallopeptidase family protein [Candidatus Polarisedimenticolia bacterium]
MKQTPVLMLIVLSLAGAALAQVPASSTIQTPDQFLGFRLGEDRKLADYDQIVEYLRRLDRASDRLSLVDLGKTTLGRSMVMAVLSAPRNLEQSFTFREMARKLADPRGVPPEQIERIVHEEQVIVLITCNIHSTEIAASQMAMELAHRLAATEDPALLGHLQNVILLLVPSLNPDGQFMEVEWYRRHLGTPHEGGRMPWLYHHYAGHDNNRDFFMLSLAETRMINRVLHHEWFPQIYLDQHQMGSTGPRLFVPPFVDPLNTNIPPLNWRMQALIGANMALRAEQAGQTGVIDSYAFDGYWPGGSMNTTWWKNVVGVLTEMASARMATPIFIDENELAGARKGLPEYRAQINFPNPWRGGWWRLRDIIDYELTFSLSLLETASRHREDFLRGMHRMAAGAIEQGRSGPPYAYVVPADQHDPPTAARMIDILREGGVEAHQASGPVRAGGREWPAGSVFILMDQPYRAFIKDMMEKQVFPEVRPAEDAGIYRPYDVTGWTLPLQMGVAWSAIDEPMGDAARAGLVRLTGTPDLQSGPRGPADAGGPEPAYYVISHRSNNATRAVNRLLKAGRTVLLSTAEFTRAGLRHEAGSILAPAGAEGAGTRRIASELRLEAVPLAGPAEGLPSALRLRTPRVGLYKPWAASMDEGWTRLVLESAEFPYENLDNAAVKAGGLSRRFDTILL